MNDVGLNLVEVRATKGGEEAAFRRYFRFEGGFVAWGGDLEGGEKKGRERGLKWGVGACGGIERGDGEVRRGGKWGVLAASRRSWGVW